MTVGREPGDVPPVQGAQVRDQRLDLVAPANEDQPAAVAQRVRTLRDPSGEAGVRHLPDVGHERGPRAERLQRVDEREPRGASASGEEVGGRHGGEI